MKGSRDLKDRLQTWVPLPPLQKADVVPVQFRSLSECLLTHRLGLPRKPQRPAKCFKFGIAAHPLRVALGDRLYYTLTVCILRARRGDLQPKYATDARALAARSISLREASLFDSLNDRMEWLKRRVRKLVPSNFQDLAQDTWARWLGRREGPAAESERAVLSTIARNLAIDDYRRRIARGATALAFDELPAALVPWIAPDQESALLLKQVILALPPLYRDTFILNRFMGLTYAEIAERFGISEKTVEYRMSRALALCQEALRD